MADKMMRIAGRDDNGLARPVKTDEDGRLQVFSVTGKSVTISNITVPAGQIVEIGRYFKGGFTEFLISGAFDGTDLAKDVEFIVQGHRAPDARDTPLNNIDFKPYSNIISQRNDGALGFIYNDVYALIDKVAVDSWSTSVNRIKYMEDYLPIHGQVWRILAHNTSTSSRSLYRVEVAMR